MENVTKALLIAAGILIVIVIVTIGILIIKNVSNTSNNADKVGEEISNATNKSSIEVLGGLKGIVISKERFNMAWEEWKFAYKQQADQEILNKKELLKDQIELIGWVYNKSNYTKMVAAEGYPTTSTTGLSKKEIGEETLSWCMKNQDKLIKLDNPLENEKTKEICKEVYEKETKNSGKYYSFDDYYEKIKQMSKYGYKGPVRFSFFWTYDETGYINKVYFVAGIIYDEKVALKK